MSFFNAIPAESSFANHVRRVLACNGTETDLSHTISELRGSSLLQTFSELHRATATEAPRMGLRKYDQGQ